MKEQYMQKSKMITQMKIWEETIPYNHAGPKSVGLQLNKLPGFMSAPAWFSAVFGKSHIKSSSAFDNYAYKLWIQKGNESLSFDDEPSITPYLTDKSDIAVIIAPGGGFCYKSYKPEGEEIAAFLNNRGISAFVLNYRLFPYLAPVCYLDMQRAIRYVRYHAKDYGLDPAKIGCMGFSAGGYVAGASHVLVHDKPVEAPGYLPDPIDEVSGIPSFIGLIYPVTGFDKNPGMLYTLIGKDYFDEAKRSEAQKKYSLSANLTPDSVPQFLCYGTKDPLQDMKDYDARLKELHINHRTLILEGAGHGFALANPKFRYWGDEYVQWIRSLYASPKKQEAPLMTLFSMSPMPEIAIAAKRQTTARLTATSNIDTETIYLRFSNRYGKKQGRIDHAAVAVLHKGKASDFLTVTCDGSRTILLPPGEELRSDPIEVHVSRGDEILVQIYTAEKAETVCGVGYASRILSGKGDQAGKLAAVVPYSAMMEKLTNQAPIQKINYLCAVDAESQPVMGISCFGDSITAQNRWVKPLTDALYQQFPGKVQVFNHGICGNRLLSDAPRNMAMFGEAGVKRLAADVLTNHGITHVLFALGGNDIGLGDLDADASDSGKAVPSADDFEAACQKTVELLHENGVKAYALSIYPANWGKKQAAKADAIRRSYNEVLKKCFDGYIDLDPVLSAGAYGYKEGYGYDDGVHLREAGGAAVAQAVFAFLRDNLDIKDVIEPEQG